MLSAVLLRISVVLALVGFGLGMYMGVTQNFVLAPAHAHLILLGFVALFLSGLYYHIVPEAGATALGRSHAWVAVIGAIVFPIGIAMERIGGMGFKPLVAGGALVVLVGAMLFALIVFRFSGRQRESAAHLLRRA